MKYVSAHSAVLAKSFNSRETYIVWRAAWRAHYRELAGLIRSAKRLRKTPLRDFLMDETAFKTALASVPADLQDAATNMYTLFRAAVGINKVWPGAVNLAFNLRSDAVQLMEIRKESKVESQRQYLLFRGTLASAAFVRCTVLQAHVREIDGKTCMLDPMLSGVVALPNDNDTKQAVVNGLLKLTAKPMKQTQPA